MPQLQFLRRRCRAAALSSLLAWLVLFGCGVASVAHPLGNSTVNRFARVRVESGGVRVRYVIDMAEIPAFQESQVMDANHDGEVSGAESADYLERLAPRLTEGVVLTSDGERVPLSLKTKAVSMPSGAGGLKTLRMEFDFESSTHESAGATHRLRFDDSNFSERIGWREIVVEPASGVTVFDSDAYGSALTDELKAYPRDTVSAPLGEHTHMPPGADGRPLTWRSLLALGVSGGLLPCPSALVVMLSAISLGRVGYGLALIVAFSVGLAATLTAAGLLFVYASRFAAGRRAGEGRLVKALPVLSALVIACAGAAICYEALAQAGINLPALISQAFSGSGAEGTGPSLASTGTLAVLGLGLAFGLKHATEVDHVVAVTTFVSEQRSIWRAAIVGGLWGAGHTASLVIVGIFVLTLRVAVPEGLADWLEFGVALMIIALGVNAVARALRGRADAHLHRHRHGGVEHAHVHFHEEDACQAEGDAGHTHAVTRVGLKPVLVGAMHGLAGSAALTLLVLAQIDSVALGLLYLAVFGLGSVLGMMLMSGMVGLPFALGTRRLGGLSYGLQVAVGALSIAFGLWYAYRTGTANGLL